MEEKIKENEGASSPDAGGDTAEPVPHKKRGMMALIREMWAAYLIEIFVIILGISITLALEEWRDKNKEKQLEQLYLKNLLTDIEADHQSLGNAIAGTNKMLEGGNQLLGYMKDSSSNNISFYNVNSDVRAILGRPKFTSHDATFSDLKSSGNLHLLEDIQLKNLLFTYYSETQIIRDNQDAEQQATISLSGSYFLKKFPLVNLNRPPEMPEKGSLHGLMTDIEFQNNVLLRVSQRGELLSLYQMTDSSAVELKKVLTEKTEN
jgi:hypothetical protein